MNLWMRSRAAGRIQGEEMGLRGFRVVWSRILIADRSLSPAARHRRQLLHSQRGRALAMCWAGA